MKNSFKKRASRAAIAGVALLGLAAGGLAVAAPAGAAGTDMLTGPILTFAFGGSRYLDTDLVGKTYSGAVPASAPIWTFPASGSSGPISTGGMCLYLTNTQSQYPAALETCNDTALRQVWTGVTSGAAYGFRSTGSYPFLALLSTNGYKAGSASGISAGYYSDWSGTLTRAVPVPTAPTLTTPLPGSDITPETVFTGTGEPNTVITVVDPNGVVIGTGTVGADKKWSLTLDPAPLNGDIYLKVVANVAGSPVTIAEGIYTMTESSDPLVVTTPQGGATIVGPDVTFDGTGQPGDTVVIKDKDGTPIGETTVNPDGSWNTTVPLPGGGTVTVESGDQTVTIEDLNVIAKLEVTTPAPDATIGTNGTEFTGTGQPGEKVVITDKDGTVLGETTIGDNGEWTTTVKVPVGSAPITVTAGEQKVVLDNLNIVDDTKHVADFEVLTPNLEEVGGSLKNGTDFTGTGEPGTTVVITDKDGNIVGETVVDEHGDWSTPVTGLPEGPNNLEITYTVPDQDPVTIDLGPVVVVKDNKGDPVMNPALAGGIGMVLLAAAGAYTGLRRRRTATQQ